MKYEHYNFKYKEIKIDPYRIMYEYKIVHPAHQHALKKLLRAGNSIKNLKQDIQEVIDSLERWIEMIDEDELIEEDKPLEIINQNIHIRKACATCKFNSNSGCTLDYKDYNYCLQVNEKGGLAYHSWKPKDSN